MIKAILRLVDGTTGAIRLDGQDLVALERRERGRDPAAFSPPSGAKWPSSSRTRDSPSSPTGACGTRSGRSKTPWAGPGNLDREALARALEQVGLKVSHVDAFPRSLSSGEMKRMDIARALAAKPEVLLLDEPFAHIDFETRARVMKAISDYMAENATILIVVTHEDFDLRYFVEQNHDFPALAGQEP